MLLPVARPYKMSRILYQDAAWCSEASRPLKTRSPKPYAIKAGNGVFVITLNDPARLNCMSLNLAQEASFLGLTL